jgi:tellurite resistance protein TerC
MPLIRLGQHLLRADNSVADGQGGLSRAASWLQSLSMHDLSMDSLRGWASTAKTVAMEALTGEPHGHADIGVHSIPGHNPHGAAKMFREEDTTAWIVFFIVFLILIIFDNVVLNAKEERLSFARAMCYSLFYMGCAACFNVYVYFIRGYDDAFNWGTGYLLEWMLSVDNLFVFRSIFVIFKTPDDQKHKPLFWGIVGAVIFRMFFFIIEEYLVHSFSWMHMVLGLFLIYTGIKILAIDEEEENPATNPWFQAIIKHIPYVDAYAPTAKFFARIPTHEEERVRNEMQAAVEEAERRAPELTGSARSGDAVSRTSSRLSEEGSPMVLTDGTSPLRATRLFLVVVCLEVTDVVFAVDSVSAIVAQIPDLFLAYTACVFAMLGLRAMFFVVDELVSMFTLLSYAVAAILVFIGLKLCLRGWIHIEPAVVCFVLVSTLVGSMVASVLWDKYKPDEDEEEASEEDTIKIKDMTPREDALPEKVSA